MALPQSLEQSITKHLSTSAERVLIGKAYDYAKKAHHGQKRLSGDDYIVHPVAVAEFLANLGLDATTVAAAILHDTLEDTKTTRSELESLFGKDVAFLVDGVTKLKAIQYTRNPDLKQKIDPQVSSLKKMFFATAEDIRVILIKLADRYHNMETMKYQDAEAQHRVAVETMEIYAPIAARLGMGHLKGELEDLAFPYAHPTEYREFIRRIKGKYADRIKYIERTKPIIVRLLKQAGINVLDAHARAKHYWSLYLKLIRSSRDVEKIYDLAAMRIIVPDIKSCYEALGEIHRHYTPVPGQIKDYIALPKPNGYRSLHTTVFCEKGRIAEIQIRTPDMHEHAENGIAAHWAYAESGKPKKGAAANTREIQWVAQLKNYLQDAKSRESLRNLKIDFFKNRIFVLTPKGDVRDLPEGATPIDFAYSIHSGLGNSVNGARIGGKLVHLDYELHSGDVVEILKSKTTHPSLDWLGFAKTTEAKKHIRAWFRANDPSLTISDGKNILNKELEPYRLTVERLSREQINVLLKLFSAKTLDALLGRISSGDINPGDVIRHLSYKSQTPNSSLERLTSFSRAGKFQTNSESQVNLRSRTNQKFKTKNRKSSSPSRSPIATDISIQGQTGVLYRLGKCCNPSSQQNIHGYITRTRGVTVHVHTCKNIKGADSQRLLKAEWV